jgi:scyllo-inositol 2-dehydrogenase (NADP+)
MIRTAVIGFGLGGSAFHAPLVAAVEGLALAAIVTSRVGDVQARHPGVEVIADPAAAFARDDIDLVVISTPNDTHVPLARAALEAGKHVVIDKPFATSVGDGEALAALAGAKGRMLSAFHNRRWDGDFLTVERLVREGVLGEVLLYEAHWDRFRSEPSQAWKESPEAGAGQLPDLGPHLIDQALQLFGLPAAISADLARQREGSRIDDYFTLTLHYGERRVVLASSRMIAAPRPRFALHGRRGSFVKYGLDPQENWLKAGKPTTDPAFGVEDPAQHGVLTLPEGTSATIESERGDYRRYYEGVVAAIGHGAPPPVGSDDAMAGLRLIQLARQSAREGRRIDL